MAMFDPSYVPATGCFSDSHSQTNSMGIWGGGGGESLGVPIHWTGLLDSKFAQNLISCTVTTTKSYCQSSSKAVPIIGASGHYFVYSGQCIREIA